MDHEQFKNKLKELNLNLTQFSELVNIPYSTVAKYGKSTPVPTWLNSWFSLYEENKNLNNFKQELKKFAATI